MNNQHDGKKIRGYEMRKAVGSGGFGTVYHAFQEILEREVAVKVINEKFVNQPQFIRQFEAEARIIARLEHLHIVTLYDYWRDPNGAYLVMRWLRGGSLRQRLKQHRFTLPEIVTLLNQISSALAFAHNQNVIHRDIKPENIMMDDQGNAFLTDFGIAVDLHSDGQISMENISFGSPEYIAPEQLVERRITPQVDIYSLGIMLFELLTHQRPFAAETAKEIVRMQLNKPIPSLKEFRPDLPGELDTIIWQATAKRPEFRYDNVMKLAVAFQNTVAAVTDLPGAYRIPNEVIEVIQKQVDSGLVSTGDISTADFGADSLAEDFKTAELGGPGATAFLDVKGEFIPTALLGSPEGMKALGMLEGTGNPYKGLRAFEEADASDFYGREDVVARLLKQFEYPNKRFMALIGPSGSGKSSVVRAGILPAFRRGAVGRSRDWFITTMVPGINPFRELSEALMRVAIRTPEYWETILRGRIEGLHLLLKQILPADGSELVIFIDQFEEVFTMGDSEKERETFLGSLWHAVNAPDSRVRVIITLRADFYDRPLYYAQFGELLRQNTEVLLPLSINELEAAILKPAERIGMVVDSHLVSTIIEDLHSQPGALPLLQYALTEIYARRQGNRLTLDEYLAIGGVSGALAQRASEIYSTLNTEDSELTRQAFLRMITINEDGTATRRRIDWKELLLGIQHPDKLNAVINAFSRYRLLTSDRDPVTRTPTLEIAHEALIAAWAQLKLWIEQNRFDLQKRQLLRLAVEEWKNSQRDRSYLASGARLAEFETLLNHPIISLNPEELSYIGSSVHQRENAARRTRIVIATLAISTIVTLFLAVLAFTSQQRAEEARAIALQERDRANAAAQVARSRELAASALSNTERHDLALLLAIEAARTAPTYEAMNSLLTSLQTDPFVERYLYGHTDWVRSIAYNSSGSMLVSGGGDGSIIRWSPLDGSPIGDPIAAHDGAISGVAVSSDDRLIASAGTDGVARLWDASDGTLVAEMQDAQAELWSVALSPDGSLMAAGAADGEILVWDVQTHALVYRIPAAHTDIIYHVAFNPAGTRLASGGGDNLVRVWDAANGEPVGEPLSGHTNWVLTLAFSPDNAVLLSSGADARVLVWNYETGAVMGELATGHRNWVRDLALSDDGQIVATASMDGTIRVWNLQSGQLIVPPLTAHTDGVWSIDFAPGDLRIASGSADQHVLLWHLVLPQRPGSLVINAGQSINAFAISEQSRRYAATGDVSGGGSSSLIVWDANANTVLHTLQQESSDQVLRIAMSPDGSLLASATTDSMITLWDVETGSVHSTISAHDGLVVSGLVFTPDNQQLISVDESGKVVRTSMTSDEQIPTTIVGSDSGVTSLAISPDGTMLAIGGRDATVTVWNLATEAMILQPTVIHEDAVITLAFNHAGTRLLSGGRDNQIVVWDLTTGQAQRETLTGHTDWILSLAVSPDDALFASAGRDNTIRLWDFDNLRPIGTPFIGHQDWVNGLYFISDRMLLASSRNGAVIEWSVDFDTWIAQACAISNRSMTSGEWQQFMTDQDYQATCEPST